MLTATEPATRAAGPRAVLVPWPSAGHLRIEAERAGRPCLLVVAPGSPIPVVGRGEDWVRADADERDVAARLDRLGAIGRQVPTGSMTPIWSLSPGHGARARGAHRLLSPVGRLVPREELVDLARPEPLDAVLAAVGSEVAAEGWSLVAIAGAGHLLVAPAEDLR